MASKYKPFIILGPGDAIKEELEFYGWTQKELSEIIGYSQKQVSNILNNKTPVTMELAKLLSATFKQSPQYWINLDANYRVALEESAEYKNTSAKALIYRYMPVSDMRRKGWLPKDHKDIKGLINAVKRFWDMTELNFDFLEKEVDALFRKSSAFKNFSPYHALTWLQQVKRNIKNNQEKKYDRNQLEKLYNNLCNYIYTPESIENFLNELSNTGVIFTLVPHLEKTYTDGASFWINGNPVIAYTARYDRIDNFWFTIAHEIAHILHHSSQAQQVFIDSLDNLDTTIETEKEADNLASKKLMISEILDYFKSSKRVNQAKIDNCSKKFKINSSIIIGCLAYHKKISYKNYGNQISKVKQHIPDKY